MNNNFCEIAAILKHDHSTTNQQQEITRGGKLASLQNNTKQRWDKLLTHAQNGLCNCSCWANGEVHVLKGCVTGRSLVEEYENSLKLLQEYKK